MRKFGVVLGLVTIGLVLLRSSESEAVRALCLSGDERLALSPTGAVTVDGFSVQRSSTSGRYEIDGGLSFDVNAGQFSAITAPGTCGDPASEVTLKLSDPFTGADFEVTLP